MQPHFECSHTTESVGLTLFDSAECVKWHADFDRATGQALVDALQQGYSDAIITAGNFVLGLSTDEFGSVIMRISGSGPYLLHKVLLTHSQAKDLAATLQIHVFASEQDGRPKDVVEPLDDRLNKGWTPEREQELYRDDPHDDDPADDWKKGKK